MRENILVFYSMHYYVQGLHSYIFLNIKLRLFFLTFLSLFLQVGIIMYLPTTDARQRKDITEEFFNYRRLTQTRLWDEYSAYEHWAKIEVPNDD